MTGKALEAHYTAVADASPVPVILYTVPALTMLDLPLETIVKLASHPNIIGIKVMAFSFWFTLGSILIPKG